MATSTETPPRTGTSVFDWPDLETQRAGGRQRRDAAGTRELLSVLHINGGLVIRPLQPDLVPVEAQPLTDREREVLALVAEGNSNKIIGDRLLISERTVKSHLTYIMTKLRASDRTHAVVTTLHPDIVWCKVSETVSSDPAGWKASNTVIPRSLLIGLECNPASHCTTNMSSVNAPESASEHI